MNVNFVELLSGEQLIVGNSVPDTLLNIAPEVHINRLHIENGLVQVKFDDEVPYKLTKPFEQRGIFYVPLQNVKMFF